MQFQADVLNVPIERSACEELSALGAAWLGGLTLGWWKSMEDLEHLRLNTDTFLPGRSVKSQYQSWRHSVAQARLRERRA
jgi:glycerol kinase